MEKNVAKYETNYFPIFVQRVSLFPLFDWRKIKDQIDERRNFLGIVFIKPGFINSNNKLHKTQRNSLKNTYKVVNIW